MKNENAEHGFFEKQLWKIRVIERGDKSKGKAPSKRIGRILNDLLSRAVQAVKILHTAQVIN